jgi:hypothetical protein
MRNQFKFKIQCIIYVYLIYEAGGTYAGCGLCDSWTWPFLIEVKLGVSPADNSSRPQQIQRINNAMAKKKVEENLE